LGTQVLAKPFDVEELQRAVSTVLADAVEMRTRAAMMRAYAQQVSVTSDRMREENVARKARMNDLVAAGWEIHGRPRQES
jgi:FixJ family two-component response regulator